jgi:molybdate transport system substrate-binding protein
MRHLSIAAALCALAFPVAAWAQQITVSAAASLTEAFKELAPRFEAARPGVTVRLNFAASGALIQQIAQGAPVDVLASADQETMDRGVQQRLIDAPTRRNFASNSLVLIEPAKDGVGLKTLQDLTRPTVKRIAVGKLATVPVGRYTKQALDAAKLWTVLEPRFVQADSVRQVLDYVARAEVEAGFVYRTDAALVGDRVKVVMSLPVTSPITYPVAVVAHSRQKELAQAFAAHLLSDTAQQVLARHGFGKP